MRILRVARPSKNKQCMKTLKEDLYSASLLEGCKEDGSKGQVAMARLAHVCDLLAIALSLWFAARQGTSFELIRYDCCLYCPGRLYVRLESRRHAEDTAHWRHDAVRILLCVIQTIDSLARTGPGAMRPLLPRRDPHIVRWIVSSSRSKLLEKLLDRNQFCGR